VQPNPSWSARGKTPTKPEGLVNATKGVVSPFGSHVSLAVTEKDTVVVFSSAKKYA
jgi:hypothetical protein